LWMYKKSPNDCHLLIKIDSKQKIKAAVLSDQKD